MDIYSKNFIGRFTNEAFGSEALNNEILQRAEAKHLERPTKIDDKLKELLKELDKEKEGSDEYEKIATVIGEYINNKIDKEK